MRAIYQGGFDLHKAGVMLLDLQPASLLQHELALAPVCSEPAASERLMRALDGVNDRYGRGTLALASSGIGGNARSWSMKQQLRTPQYTTRWSDLPVARA